MLGQIVLGQCWPPRVGHKTPRCWCRLGESFWVAGISKITRHDGNAKGTIRRLVDRPRSQFCSYLGRLASGVRICHCENGAPDNDLLGLLLVLRAGRGPSEGHFSRFPCILGLAPLSGLFGAPFGPSSPEASPKMNLEGARSAAGTIFQILGPPGRDSRFWGRPRRPP